MKMTFGVFVGTALLIAGGCGPPDRSGDSGPVARSAIEKAFQAKLPTAATGLHVYSEALMTLCVYGRFECPPADFEEFLAASALLPDTLEPDTNPLAEFEKTGMPWWQPASLQSASGADCRWDADPDVAVCTLAAGRSEKGKDVLVYFMIVYENKKATGLRPDVKADPYWGSQ